MPYTKTVWQNGQAPDINQDNLNKIEQGIYDAHADIATNLTDFNTHQNDFKHHVYYGVATGLANTYAVTLNPSPTAYTDGLAVAVKINVTNTGASMLNVNGLGALALKKSNGDAFDAGELIVDSIYTFRYNGVNFILQGEGGGGLSYKSYQAGEVTLTNGYVDVTINPVDTTKSYAAVNGVTRGGTSASLSNFAVAYEWISSTVLRIKRGTQYGTWKDILVSYQIYECDGIKPIQRGVCTITTGAPYDAYYHYYKDVAINTIVPSKSFIIIHMYSNYTDAGYMVSTRRIVISANLIRFFQYAINAQFICYDIIEIK